MTTGWYELGKFRVLVKPIFDNPYFMTHHIYVGLTCIGKQLSVPTLDDCEGHERRRIALQAVSIEPPPYQGISAGRRGRQRKAA